MVDGHDGADDHHWNHWLPLIQGEAISCEDEFSENAYRRNTESDDIHSIGTSCDPEVYAGARFITRSF